MRVRRPHLTAAVVASRCETRRRIAAAFDGSGVEIVGQVADAAELEAQLDGVQPDAVVVACFAKVALDVRRTIRDLKRRFPATRIVAVVPGRSASRIAKAALDAHAEGVVYRSEVQEALVPTVCAVHADQQVLPRPEYRRVEPAVLSARERQVLRLAVQGETNDAIARALYVSSSTVKSHLTSSFAKLSVRSRSEAAAVLLNPEEPASRQVFSQVDDEAPVAVAAGAGGDK
jgi:DNA-binding NarL/FixJ family response regulator